MIKGKDNRSPAQTMLDSSMKSISPTKLPVEKTSMTKKLQKKRAMDLQGTDIKKL
jgi:hypothetical protein